MDFKETNEGWRKRVTLKGPENEERLGAVWSIGAKNEAKPPKLKKVSR
jgi:hypothetical protein